MNMIVERIPVHKHFLVIDSPIPFTLRANNGTDEVYRMAGAWRIDLYTILTEKYFKQFPVFVLEMVYDEDLLQPGETIEVRQSDIDFGSGIAGVNGQDVRVTNFDELKKNYKVIDSSLGHTLQDLIDAFYELNLITSDYDYTYINCDGLVYANFYSNNDVVFINANKTVKSYNPLSLPNSNTLGFLSSVVIDKSSSPYGVQVYTWQFLNNTSLYNNQNPRNYFVGRNNESFNFILKSV